MRNRPPRCFIKSSLPVVVDSAGNDSWSLPTRGYGCDVSTGQAALRSFAHLGTPPSSAQSRGSLSVPHSLVRTDHYTDQHTPWWDGGDLQRICITAPHHPLHGQTFPILQRRLKRGEPHFIIQLPSGATQLIPARWTTSSPVQLTATTPLLTSGSLRRLVNMVDMLRSSLFQEATHDLLNSPRALDHVQSPDPASTCLSVDPLAPAPSSGAAGASSRRSS